jgi:hypothetical protein
MNNYYFLPCDICSQENDISLTVCPNCGSTIPEPINVKRALLPIEIQALQNRYSLAKQELRSKNLSNEVRLLEENIISNGRAIINTSFDFLWKLFFESTVSYQSYRRLVLENLRQSAEFQNDLNRSVADSFLFGSAIDIIYAALSINERGVTSYGDVSIILKIDSIEKRTSALETNSFYFFSNLVNKGVLKFGKPFPPGFMSTWRDKHKLAVAKLKDSILSGDDFQRIAHLILNSYGDRANDEFIELYIYGKIIEASIEKVVIPSTLKFASDRKIELRINELSKKINLDFY